MVLNNFWAQAIAVSVTAIAMTGCGHSSIKVVASGSTSHPPPSSELVSNSQTSAAQYRNSNLKLDAAFQRLSTHMDLTAQLSLSSEQTTWLNERVNACMQNGAPDYGCAVRMTNDRVAALNAQPLPAPLIIPKAKSLPPVLPVVARAKAPQIQPQLSVSRLILTPVQPVQPAAEASPSAPTKTPANGHIYAVAVTAMPWIWHNGGINQDFSFGYPNGTPPTLVPLATAGAKTGDLVTIKYTGGRVAFGTGGPSADGDGFTGLYSNGSRSQLGAFPSTYMRPYPINLGALVGAFTDSSGAIVGQPFAIGNGTVRRLIPSGAARLQLGINDDNFGGMTADTRNSGKFMVSVTVAKASTLP